MSAVIEESSLSSSDNLNNNDDKSAMVPKHKPPFWGFGILCCILCCVGFSFNAMLVKLILSMPALQQSASRCYGQFLILLPYVTYNWKVNSVDIFGPPGMFKFLLLRGFTGSSAAICLYQSVQRISLGDAVTLTFSNVIFAGFLSYLLLGESLTVLDGVMAIVSMAGIVLISKPSFIFGGLGFENDMESIIGVLFGLASGILIGITYIIMRKLGKATHASLNVIYYSITGSLSASCILAATGSFTYPCWHEIPYVVLLGITGVAAQAFMTIGLHYERATTFAVLRAFQIVFVFILQVVVLHDDPSMLSMIGAGLIFVSIFVLAIRKVYNTMSKRRNKDT